VEYTWDEQGRLAEKRLIEDVGYHYTWTEDGLLAEVRCPDGRVVEMRHDPFGRRVLKRVYAPAEPFGSRRRGPLLEQVRFVWDGDSLVHEIKTRAEGDGAALVEERTYGFEDDGFVPLFQVSSAFGPGPGVFHFVNDPVGAPDHLVDGAGRRVCSLDRTAWGAAGERAGAATSTPLRFQGQYADEETGLHDNRYRVYDPVIGLYLSSDPLGLQSGVRPYGYGWNPTHWIDPLGLVTHTPGTGVVYLRIDPNTGKEYVGKSKSKEAYEKRKAAHRRAQKKKCPGAKPYDFEVLQDHIGSAPALAQAEEDWIRAGGGPGGKPGQSGPLENKMHGQAKGKYKGPVPFP
jgi:RHS repeat-associated protein